MYRFFGQPKFNATHYEQGPIGYELLIRERINGCWCLPQNFEAIPGDVFADLLQKTILSLPNSIELVSFNLEQSHFISAEYLEMVKEVQALTSIHLYTELTERDIRGVSITQLRAAAREFYNSDLSVAVDDVGTGQNNDETVSQLDDYTGEYKFALQNLRPFKDLDEVLPLLDHWWRRAQAKHKLFAIEGIETGEELKTITRDFPSDVLQGFYLGKPAVIPLRQPVFNSDNCAIA